MQLTRTNSKNIDFIELVKLLDADLAIRDGDDHAFYDQFNKIDTIHHIIVAYNNGTPVGCGAIKQFDEKTMEIKRMYTTLKNRGKGVASLVIDELEKWTKELSFERCILETGFKQPEAIALYKKKEFKLITNYGQYTDIETSKCFEKLIH